jgi:hypothetical protein
MSLKRLYVLENWLLTEKGEVLDQSVDVSEPAEAEPVLRDLSRRIGTVRVTLHSRKSGRVWDLYRTKNRSVEIDSEPIALTDPIFMAFNELATHLHKNTGNGYVYVGQVHMEHPTDHCWITGVKYRDEEGNEFVRSLERFEDRFEAIPGRSLA